MNMKKWLIPFIGIVALLVVSCGGSNESSSNTKDKVEIDIFQFKVEIASQLESATKRYMELNPNVKINLTTVGGGDDYGAALRAQFSSGQEPEIFNIGGPQDVQSWMGNLENLGDQPWVSSASAGTLDGVTVDGEVYGLPFAVEGYGFIYNKAIFEAAGIDASKITSFAALESAVKTLDVQISAGELASQFPLLEAVFEFPAKETWVTGLHLSNAVMNHEFKSSLDAFSSESVDFTYGDAMQALVDLQADFSSSSNKKQMLNAVDYATQVDGGIAIERVAIIQQGNWVYGGVEAVDSEVAANLGILPMPVKGGIENSIPIGVPMYWSVNSKSSDDQKAAAKDFLNWLYNSEEGKEIVVHEFLFIPPLTNYDNLEPKDSLGQAVKSYADAGNTTGWVFMGYPDAWGMDVLGNEIQKYLAGNQSWSSVLSNSRTKWESDRK